MEILRENNLKTTFFLTGFWIDKYPDLVKQIAAEGHELGNHTATHPHLNTLDKSAIKEELKKVHASLYELTGQEPFLFRAPFGEYSNKVIEAAGELNYFTIQWSVDSLTAGSSKQEIASRVTGQLHPGAIVLFTTTHHTAAAQPETCLRQKKGCDCSCLELIYKDNYYIDSSDGAQKAAKKVRLVFAV